MRGTSASAVQRTSLRTTFFSAINCASRRRNVGVGQAQAFRVRQRLVAESIAQYRLAREEPHRPPHRVAQFLAVASSVNLFEKEESSLLTELGRGFER